METARRKKARKNLGKKIRELRVKQKISQGQLAFECSLSRQQISYLESGYQNVKLDTLLAISEVLDIKLKELLDFDY